MYRMKRGCYLPENPIGQKKSKQKDPLDIWLGPINAVTDSFNAYNHGGREGT